MGVYRIAFSENVDLLIPPPRAHDAPRYVLVGASRAAEENFGNDRYHTKNRLTEQHTAVASWTHID